MENLTVKPIFINCNDLPRDTSSYDVCYQLEEITGYESIVCAQRIGKNWFIYPKTNECRNRLLRTTVSVNHTEVKLTNEITKTFKLIIGYLPLNFNESIMRTHLSNLGIEMKSKIYLENLRAPDGKLTHWFSGRRYVYIEELKNPLPQSIIIGDYKVTLSCKEKDNKEATLSSQANSSALSQLNSEDHFLPTPITAKMNAMDTIAENPRTSRRSDSNQEVKNGAVATFDDEIKDQSEPLERNDAIELEKQSSQSAKPKQKKKKRQKGKGKISRRCSGNRFEVLQESTTESESEESQIDKPASNTQAANDADEWKTSPLERKISMINNIYWRGVINGDVSHQGAVDMFKEIIDTLTFDEIEMMKDVHDKLYFVHKAFPELQTLLSESSKPNT